jgi:ketosteroid isomerase-like protein
MLKLVETVQSIYAAFGTGNVPAILERLHEDVDWEQGADGHGVPWLAPGRGRAHVARFFQTIGEELEITAFAPKTFCEGPGVVVALIDIEWRVRRTGQTFRERDEAHVWHFDAAGRVVAFRHRVDTAMHVTAWNGGRAG